MAINIEVETVSCCICKNTNAEVIASGTDREYFTSLNTYHVVKCQSCALLYLSPRPIEKELSTIYPSNYHSYIIDTEPKKISLLTQMRYKAHISRFAKILKYVPDDKKINLLDVGCGDGWMMQLFKRAAPDRITTYGVEIAEEACAAARKMGNTVYCGRIEDVQFDRQFDLINYNHVIEHVSDPQAVTQKSYDILQEGGFLVYETPNADTWDWKHFREGNWGAYHFPRHWYFFTPESIKKMGESVGFEYVTHYYHPAPTHWVWTLHNVSLKYNNFLGRIGRKLFDPIKIFRGGMLPFFLLGVFTVVDLVLIKLTKRSSVMTVIFRKPALS